MMMRNGVREIRCADAEHWRATAAKLISHAINRALVLRGRASIVIPGGRTATEVLPVVAKEVSRWDRVAVVLSDERWVEIDHPDSNEGLVRALLPKSARVVGLKTSHAAIARLYAQRHFDQVVRPFDVVFLGMGEDGHVASLFPGERTIARAEKTLRFAECADHLRLSLSSTMLLDARELVLPVSGKKKNAILSAAMRPGPEQTFPVRILLRRGAPPLTIIRCSQS